jgi:hypothetical protein
MRNLSVAAFISALSLAGIAVADVIFYGGDADATGGVASERNTGVDDARTYDDFDVAKPTVIQGVWGNFLLDNWVPKVAYYEIRSNVSQHNGGTLVANGQINVNVIETGRTVFNFPERQVRGQTPPIFLQSGRYWLTIAPVGFGFGRSFVSESSGTDEGPAGDPNPPITGGPIGDGNGFIDSKTLGFNFETIDNAIGEDTDVSLGVGVLTSVARTYSLADTFSVTRGQPQNGGLYELWGPDDKRLVVQQRRPVNAAGASVQVVSETATPVPPNPNGNSLTLTFETRCTAFPASNILERIEVYDFQAQAWTVVSEQNPSASDTRTVVTRIGHFVEPVTNKLRARISWLDRGAINLNWSSQIDWILWDISP